MGKTIQSIIVNEEPRRPFKCTVDIGRTKGVEIAVSKNRLRVSAFLSTASRAEDMLTARTLVLSKALKRAMILHILRYNEPVSAKTYTCRSGGSTAVINEARSEPVMYSMVSGRLLRNVSPEWKKERYLKGFARCDDQNLAAAVGALLISKTKLYETERFLYLWMAINGMYNFYFENFFKSNDRKESDILRRFANLYGFGPVMNEKIAPYSKAKADSVIFRRSADVFLSEIKQNDSGSSLDLLRTLGVRDSGFSAYGYYLLKHCYKYRCDMFHANRQVKLLSFAEEAEIIALRTLSSLLEEFLDNNLHRWFDREYLDNAVKPVATDNKSYIDPFTGERETKSK